MQDAVQHRQLIRFGIFEADLEAGELRRNGRKIRLAEQPFQVLAILLERPGRVASREELQKRLWPDTIVEVEHSLNTAVNKIREALGDSAENPRFVETLPRRGYRFIAPILDSPEGGPTDSNCTSPANSETAPVETERLESTSAGATRRSGRKWMLLGLGIALPAAAIFAAWILRSPLPPPRITDYAQLTNDGRARTIGGTDGNKLFVNAIAPGELALVSVVDGRSAPFRIDVPDAKQCGSTVPTVRDVSVDGSWFLVLCSVGLDDNQVWIVGALGRPARVLINAQDAAWSADAKAVVYSTPEGAIYRVPSEGGDSRLLVPPMASKGQLKFVRDLAWSPHGRSIRFTNEQAIWEVTANGENLHRLLSAEEWKEPSCCGRWTPDGDFFVFIYGETDFHPSLSQSAAQLWVLDERHSRFHRRKPEPTLLLGGPTRWADPIPSRDGTRIFARGVNVRGELVRYDAQVKQLQPYLGGMSSVDVAFSRDGRYVAYVTFPDGVVWRANRDGSNVVQLTQSTKGHASAPFWSPDGTQIIYEAEVSAGQNAVMVVPSQGGSPKPLLAEENGFYNDANWSPDGKHIVFASLPLSPKVPLDTRKASVKIFDVESRQISVLPGSEATYSPRWSPDGRYIAGLSLPGFEVRLYDLKTRKWLATPGKQGANAPAWSRDSRFIYALYWGEEIGIYRVPIAGGPSEPVLDLTNIRQTGWWGSSFSLDPGDAPLVLRDAGSYEIYSLTLDRE